MLEISPSADGCFKGRLVWLFGDVEPIAHLEVTEIPGITGAAIDSHEDLPGPIMLQGDHGRVSFRNIMVAPGK